jgi:toxin ParE1/3/4
LVNLWLHLAHEANPSLASNYLQEIGGELTRLALFPLSGRPRDELYPGLRSMPFDRLVLFYLPLPDGIDLLRVLAGARDLERIAEEGGFETRE